MYRHHSSGKIAGPPLLSTRPLDQVRERIRYLHYGLITEKAFPARLLYGTCLRLAEGLAVRVKDIDFDRHVRSGKRDKDRVVMLPRRLVPALRQQLADECGLWAADAYAASTSA